jgi:N-methylhydantoinase A
VNLRVTGIGPIRRPTLRPAPPPDASAADPTAADAGAAGAVTPTPAGSRPVCFDRSYLEIPIFRRPDLPPGSTVTGPAIIEEYGSTVPVHPGFQATVDPFTNLVLTRP